MSAGKEFVITGKELMTANYMEALLRAALLLGDLHTTIPISEITIAAFHRSDPQRTLLVRCRITTDLSSQSASLSESYLILYPSASFT